MPGVWTLNNLTLTNFQVLVSLLSNMRENWAVHSFQLTVVTGQQVRSHLVLGNKKQKRLHRLLLFSNTSGFVLLGID